MKKNNFVIIGGQYASYCYVFTPTLTGAKWSASCGGCMGGKQW